MKPVFAIILSLFFVGCLSSPNPFYNESDAIQDDRILCGFRDANGGFSISRYSSEKYYHVHFYEGEKGEYWIDLKGVLFMVKDRLFLDLTPIGESSFNHIAGTSPGMIEIIHALSYQSRHFVARVDFSDEGVGFSVPDAQHISTLIGRNQDLKGYYREHNGLLSLPMDTPDLQKFLEKHALDETLFFKPQKFYKSQNSVKTSDQNAPKSKRSSEKNSKANVILNELRQVDAAREQWALEHKKTNTEIPKWEDLLPYFKPTSDLAKNLGKDFLGNPFVLESSGKPIRVPSATKETLKDVADDIFWGPYS